MSQYEAVITPQFRKNGWATLVVKDGQPITSLGETHTRRGAVWQFRAWVRYQDRLSLRREFRVTAASRR